MENKIKVGDIVIAPKGCESWFTPGKEYKVIKLFFDLNSEIFIIENDEKQECWCLPKKCHHLNKLNWIIKK